MTYLNAFLCGGLLCAVGQILIDRTQLTPARILTGYVVAGVLLQAVGLYQPLVDWGGAGATVPLTGFGYCLAKGVAKAVAEKGLLGALTGGLTAAAGGIAAAVVFGVLAALIFHLTADGEMKELHEFPALSEGEGALAYAGEFYIEPLEVQIEFLKAANAEKWLEALLLRHVDRVRQVSEELFVIAEIKSFGA